MTESAAQDPICGMTVNPGTALHAERGGGTFYFCSEHCKTTFLATPDGAEPKRKAGGCCAH